MRILAVSDSISQRIENLVVHSPKKLKNVDIIVSCGDLEGEYLELLVDGLNRDLYFVCGNHPVEKARKKPASYEITDRLWENIHSKHDKIIRIAGREDLHGRIEVCKDYFIVGFGGSLWYGGRGNEFREKEMARIVNSIAKKIRWHRLKEKVSRNKPRKVIVLSHAPLLHVHDLPDRCHTGFKCFHDFTEKISPVLWIHGHVHIPDMHKNQVTMVGQTTVVNAFSYKFINIKRGHIEISYKHDILDT